MRKYIFTTLAAIAAACMMTTSCMDDAAADGQLRRDSLPMLVTQIQRCAKLYTTEFRVHKIITYRDNKAISGKVMGMKIEAGLPMSQRKIAIPLDATLKAYIDFGEFTEENVIDRNGKIEIILPEPKLTLTSSTIDHKNIRRHVDFLRGNFSDEELTRIEQNGRNAVLEEMSRMDLMGHARQTAVSTLVPLMQRMGYREEDITITFSKSAERKDLRTLLKNIGIENGE